MLSYRHAFHAGNHADVLKHLTLSLVLDYYNKKDKPYWYIDTHAGRGLYNFKTAEAQKNREFDQGIAYVWKQDKRPDSLKPYLSLIQKLNEHNKGLQQYPGSPWIAAQFLRPQDGLRLFELHPNDYTALNNLFSTDRRAQSQKEDGLKGLLGLVPPPPRRAVTLIDPAYELKNEYADVVQALVKAYKRFATGTYLLWYPVVNRHRINQMQTAFIKAAIPDLMQVELNVLPDNENLGMTGSGLFIINPPWTLIKDLQTLLPWLTHTLAGSIGSYLCRQLTTEN